MYNLEKIVAHLIDNASEWSIAVLLGSILFLVMFFIFKFAPQKMLLSKQVWVRIIGSILSKINLLFLLATSVYCTLKLSPAPDKIVNSAQLFFAVVFLVQAAYILTALINFWISSKIKNISQDGDSITMFNAIGLFLKLIVIVLTLLIVLQTLGFNVSALIAGLGIGGIAVALAAQNILGDLFASVSILLDKPFVVGDVIATSDFKGTVEHIGLKTTSIKGENGEQIIISNSALLKTTLRNFKHVSERNVVFQIKVSYKITPELLSNTSNIIKNAMSNIQGCRLDRCGLKSFSESAINFEISYFVHSLDLNTYLNIQEKVNLAIFAEFKKCGIYFAYIEPNVLQIDTKL